jgi:hypothetical protein
MEDFPQIVRDAQWFLDHPDKKERFRMAIKQDQAHADRFARALVWAASFMAVAGLQPDHLAEEPHIRALKAEGSNPRKRHE